MTGTKNSGKRRNGRKDRTRREVAGEARGDRSRARGNRSLKKKKLYKVCQRNKGDRISLIPAILMSKMSLISSGFWAWDHTRMKVPARACLTGPWLMNEYKATPINHAGFIFAPSIGEVWYGVTTTVKHAEAAAKKLSWHYNEACINGRLCFSAMWGSKRKRATISVHIFILVNEMTSLGH